MLNKLLSFFKKDGAQKAVPFQTRLVGYKIVLLDKSSHDMQYTCSSKEATEKSLKEVDEALKELKNELTNAHDNDFINCLGVLFQKKNFGIAYHYNYPKS